MLLPEMDPREKATLKNCLNCFLEDLDPTLTFLSLMVCSGVITDDQKDRIEVKFTTQPWKLAQLINIICLVVYKKSLPQKNSKPPPL